MMRYIIPLALILTIAGTAVGTMWLYDDPMFFKIGPAGNAPTFQKANISALDIIGAPYFQLLGQSFYMSPIPVSVSSAANSIQIGSKSSYTKSPFPVTFSGNLENNLKYATAKSSLRVGQDGSWNNL